MIWRNCEKYNDCKEAAEKFVNKRALKTELDILHCDLCPTYRLYFKGFQDGAKAACEAINKRMTEGIETIFRDL